MPFFNRKAYKDPAICWDTVFDDYEKDVGKSRKFAVGSVVDEFLNKNNFYSYLIEFRGHLFDKSNKEKNSFTFFSFTF